MSDERLIIPLEEIAPTIVRVRGQRVILDSDLARLYGVETRTLNQAVSVIQTGSPVILDGAFGGRVPQLEITICDSSEWGGRRSRLTLLPNTALSWRLAF